jgi:hypothetical protein
MKVVGLLGFLALTLTAFAVGFRLIWQAARTRQMPELMIGGAFVFAGGVPGLTIAAADASVRAGAAPAGGLLAVASVSLFLGASMLTFFTWRVFRPTERWGAALFAAIVAGLGVGHLGNAGAALGPGATLAVGLTWVGVLFRIAAYGWAVAESIREYRAARRRCAIGLTDALVANRMLLWAIGLGAVLAIWVHEAFLLAAGHGVATSFSYLVVALFGFVCSGSLWLAFFPPVFYQRRFAAAHGADR